MSSNQFEAYSERLHTSFGISKIHQIIKPVELLKKSKQLILDTKRFLNYADYYTDLTTTHSFKVPDVKKYPMQKNFFAISLQNQPVKRTKETIDAYNSRNTPTTQRVKRDEEMCYTARSRLSKPKIFSNDEIQETAVTEANMNQSINEISFLKLIDQFNNMNSVIYRYISYKEKYALPNDINDYSFLESKLHKHKITHDILNEPKTKENSFDINDNNIRITMKCNSIRIIIYMKEEEEENNMNSTLRLLQSNSQKTANYKNIGTLSFPFELIPFFYGLSFDYLKLFLSLVILYENQAFSINNKTFDYYYPYFKENKEFFKNDSLFSLLNNRNSNIQLEYSWVTYDKLYRIRFKLPNYLFIISDINNTNNQYPLTIEKALDIRHLIFFMKNDFKDWDLFLINSLCVYKEFRSVVNQALSLNTKKRLKKKIIIDHLCHVKSPLDFSGETWEFFYSNKEKQSYFMKLRSMKLKVLFGDNDNNNNHIEPIVYSSEETTKTFVLSMKQTRLLIKARQILSIEEIFRRCIMIKKPNQDYNGLITGDFYVKTLELFDDDYCQFLQDQKDIIKSKEEIFTLLNLPPNNMNNKTGKNYDVQYIEPTIEWEYHSSSKPFEKKIYLFSPENADEFMKIPIRDWEDYLRKKLPANIFSEGMVFKVNQEVQFYTEMKGPKRKKTSKIRFKSFVSTKKPTSKIDPSLISNFKSKKSCMPMGFSMLK